LHILNCKNQKGSKLLATTVYLTRWHNYCNRLYRWGN